jgi:hypothetical protein
MSAAQCKPRAHVRARGRALCRGVRELRAPGERFGSAVANAFDLNGDGYGDLVVGRRGLETAVAAFMCTSEEAEESDSEESDSGRVRPEESDWTGIVRLKSPTEESD